MALLWKLKSVTGLEWLEALVLRDEIYFSYPPDLNDPSETRFNLRYDYSSANYEDLEKVFWEFHPEATSEEFLEYLDSVMDGRVFQPMENILRESIFNHFRVFCLTKSATNPLMWAHYADNHHGVGVGLDIKPIIKACHVAVHGEVRYQDEPFSLKFDPSESTESLLTRLAPALFTKNSRWSYEQEFRAVTFMQPPAQRAPGAVQAVILGLRATSDTHERVRDWKDQRPELRIFQASQDNSSYELKLLPLST